MNTMQTIIPLAVTAFSALIGCAPEMPNRVILGTLSHPNGEGGPGGEDTGDIEEASQAPAEPDAFLDLSLDAREELVQTYTVDPTVGVTVEGAEGSTVQFWPNSVQYSDGSNVIGEVDVELIEVFDKGTMLVTDMPSMGRIPGGGLAQLISGGEHYVNVTQDDEDLQLVTNFMLRAPAENTGGLDYEMSLFRAENADGGPAGRDEQGVWIEQELSEVDGLGFGEEPWVTEDHAPTDDELSEPWGTEAGDPVGDTTTEEGPSMSYWILSDQFGWTNIDKWFDDPRPKTTMYVSVPDGWDGANSAVYLSYDNEPTALAPFDQYNETTELFSEHYGQVPIGLEVHVIFVTESEGQWSYAIQGQTIVEDHLTTFASADDFVETDMAGLVAVINALP